MHSQIPLELLSKAYISENGERAWSKDDVLKVISSLSESHLAVLGGEVWLPTTPGPTNPTPYFYSFETERLPEEHWDDYVSRANATAIDYVTTFQWDAADTKHHGLSPIFNLTISEE